MTSTRFLVGFCLWGVLACGGDAQVESASVERTTEPTAGDETPGDTAPAARRRAPRDAEDSVDEDVVEAGTVPAGRARLRVTNRIEGVPNAGGEVRVLDARSRREAGSGASGDSFDLAPGTYIVVGHVTDPAVLIAMPTKEREEPVTLTGGEEVSAFIDFLQAKVKIRVVDRGRDVRRWSLTITRRGTESTVTLEPSEDYVNISAGRWDGTLRVGNREVPVEDLVFQAGARRDIPINVR